MGLEQLLEYILGFDDVWWATTLEVAEYWHAAYPPASLESATPEPPSTR